MPHIKSINNPTPQLTHIQPCKKNSPTPNQILHPTQLRFTSTRITPTLINPPQHHKLGERSRIERPYYNIAYTTYKFVVLNEEARVQSFQGCEASTEAHNFSKALLVLRDARSENSRARKNSEKRKRIQYFQHIKSFRYNIRCFILHIKKKLTFYVQFS